MNISDQDWSPHTRESVAVHAVQAACHALLDCMYGGDDIRFIATAAYGAKMTPAIHQRCDAINQALSDLRRALSREG